MDDKLKGMLMIPVICIYNVNTNDKSITYFTKGKCYEAYHDQYGMYYIETDKGFIKKYSWSGYSNIFSTLIEQRNNRIDSILE